MGGAVGGMVEQTEISQPSDTRPSSKLNVDLLAEQGVSSSPNSPRRFANQGMVYLSEIESLDDLNELSTKQVKELLAMNRNKGTKVTLKPWTMIPCAKFVWTLRLCVMLEC